MKEQGIFSQEQGIFGDGSGNWTRDQGIWIQGGGVGRSALFPAALDQASELAAGQRERLPDRDRSFLALVDTGFNG
jgi:hypothetical protein